MIETCIGNFKTMDDFEFDGKRVLVRVDINSPVDDGEIQSNERLLKHALTLEELSKRHAKVVVLAHQGRPGGRDYMESMEQHAEMMSEIIRVDYVDDIFGDTALKKIENIEKGQVIMLKNIRSIGEEFDPSDKNIIVEKLLPYFDLFVNDGFSVSHRNQTSIVSFPKRMESCIGRVMENELNAIEKLKKRSMLYVLGGAKPSDNIILLKDENTKEVLSTGIFSLLCMSANGIKLGKSDEKLNKDILPEIEKFKDTIRIPSDVAVYDNGRKELSIEQLPSEKEILDIGKNTIEDYSRKIKNSEAVFMKGPAGKFEEDGFSKGTVGILKAIAESDCFSLRGGGHSSHVIEKFGLDKKKFSHISLAGGALIAYLSGKKLPGLEALKNV